MKSGGGGQSSQSEVSMASILCLEDSVHWVPVSPHAGLSLRNVSSLTAHYRLPGQAARPRVRSTD